MRGLEQPAISPRAAVQAGPLITEIGVVVPARNEAGRLSSCLHALQQATARVAVDVRVVVVLDSCEDGSLGVAHRFRRAVPATGGQFEMDLLEVAVGNVGAARAAGMHALLTGHATESMWLATTDADSTVPRHWLAAQLEHAERGFDVVIGTVSFSGTDTGYRDGVLALAQVQYARAVPPLPTGPGKLQSDAHGHVHGANLGVHADAYLAAGGFLPLEVHEDVALVAALTAIGCRLAWVDDIPVVTSTRRDGRTPAGFAGYLRDLEQDVFAAPTDATGSHLSW